MEKSQLFKVTKFYFQNKIFLKLQLVKLPFENERIRKPSLKVIWKISGLKNTLYFYKLAS